MNFLEQSYGGTLFRPRPTLHFCENPCLLLLATPWGKRKDSQVLIEELVSYLSQVSEDTEKTSLYKKKPSLGIMENHLRSAALHVNEILYGKNKKDPFHAGVELLLILFHHGKMYWIQYGAPHFFIHQPQEPCLQSFFSGVNDWSQYFFPQKPICAPLPRYLLGVDAYCDFKVESLSLSSLNPSESHLVFLTSPYIPSSFYKYSGFAQDTLAQAVRLLSTENGDYPFWLGAFPFKALPPEVFS